jgi:hypothetical protein
VLQNSDEIMRLPKVHGVRLNRTRQSHGKPLEMKQKKKIKKMRSGAIRTQSQRL